VDKLDILEKLWMNFINHAKLEEETKNKQIGRNISESNSQRREIDRDARDNTKRDPQYATIQAFQRIVLNINPEWLLNIKISGENIDQPVALENIWDTIHRYLQCKEQIKTQNR